MAWCKLEDTFHRHWKWDRLAAGLRCTRVQARGHVSTMLSWAVLHSPDGDLRELTDKEVEAAADWLGKPGRFIEVASSKEVQFLEKTSNGLIIHGFLERSGSRQEVLRKQEERRKKLVVQDSTSPRPSEKRGEERRREERREDLIASDKGLPSQDFLISDPPFRGAAKKPQPPRGCIPEFEKTEIAKRLLENTTHAVQSAWVQAFGAALVCEEIKKAHAWIEANPRRRPKVFAKFFTNWLSRAYETSRKQVPSNKPEYSNNTGYSPVSNVPSLEETNRRAAAQKKEIEEWKTEQANMSPLEKEELNRQKDLIWNSLANSTR